MKHQPQKHFTIENYELDNNEVTVMLEKYNAGIPVTIPQDKFEWWLRINDKLQWELNTSDHTGEHQQFTGTMSLDEYWNTDSHFIRQDLYSYITTNPITRDGVMFSNSVDSLNLAFDLHNAQRINPVFNTRWEHDQESIRTLAGNVVKLKQENEELKKPKYYLFGERICSIYFSYDFVDLCLWMQEPGNARDWETFELTTGNAQDLLVAYDGWNGFAEITKEEYDSLNMVIEALDYSTLKILIMTKILVYVKDGTVQAIHSNTDSVRIVVIDEDHFYGSPTDSNVNFISEPYEPDAVFENLYEGFTDETDPVEVEIRDELKRMKF